jgi:hypothetical protein
MVGSIDLRNLGPSSSEVRSLCVHHSGIKMLVAFSGPLQFIEFMNLIYHLIQSIFSFLV